MCTVRLLQLIIATDTNCTYMFEWAGSYFCLSHTYRCLWNYAEVWLWVVSARAGRSHHKDPIRLVHLVNGACTIESFYSNSVVRYLHTCRSLHWYWQISLLPAACLPLCSKDPLHYTRCLTSCGTNGRPGTDLSCWKIRTVYLC